MDVLEVVLPRTSDNDVRGREICFTSGCHTAAIVPQTATRLLTGPASRFPGFDRGEETSDHVVEIEATSILVFVTRQGIEFGSFFLQSGGSAHITFWRIGGIGNDPSVQVL